MELGDDEVLVVARVADRGGPVRGPREVAAGVGLRRDVVAADRPGRVVARLRDRPDLEADAVVELGRSGRAVAVDRVEVQRRLTEVEEVRRHETRRERREVRPRDVADRGVAVRVRGEIVVDELAPVGVDRRDRRVGERLERLGRGRWVLDHRGAERLERSDRGRGGRRVRARQVVVGEVGGEAVEEVVERRPRRRDALGGDDRLLGAGQRGRLLGVLGQHVPAVHDLGQDLAAGVAHDVASLLLHGTHPRVRRCRTAPAPRACRDLAGWGAGGWTAGRSGSSDRTNLEQFRVRTFSPSNSVKRSVCGPGTGASGQPPAVRERSTRPCS